MTRPCRRPDPLDENELRAVVGNLRNIQRWLEEQRLYGLWKKLNAVELALYETAEGLKTGRRGRR